MEVKFSYKVPNFSVLAIDLRRVKFQVALKDLSVIILDGFIRADPSLESRSAPVSIKLLDWCFVSVRKANCTSKWTFSNTISA